MTGRRAALLATTLVFGCGTAAATASEQPLHREQSGPPRLCDLEPVAKCGVGRLPRVDGSAWFDGDGKRLLDLAKKGTVAAIWDGKRARFIDGCALDGRYTEVAGEAGSGRFWSTNRVIFRTDELPPACAQATHVVATFVTRPAARKGASSSGPSAILVPLPCPSTSDPKPALGCIGRGLTGPQRLERAKQLLTKLRATGVPDTNGIVYPDVALGLEIFALIPDEYDGVLQASRGQTEDCALHSQAEWVLSQYIGSNDQDGNYKIKLAPDSSRPALPRLDEQGSADSCEMRPAFLQCFPGIFDPVPAGPGCWFRPETLSQGAMP